MKRAFVVKLGAERDDAGHHIFFYLEHGGSQYTVGKLAHSWSGTLNNTQIGMLAKKLCLQVREFEGFVACDVTRDELIQLWLGRRPSG
ncbi:MAG: hypothetical protein HY691_10645 [Chloroflexi bacterium]|nr:hypothetical protein [Chloroflexota bacterium]